MDREASEALDEEMAVIGAVEFGGLSGKCYAICGLRCRGAVLWVDIAVWDGYRDGCLLD